MCEEDEMLTFIHPNVPNSTSEALGKYNGQFLIISWKVAFSSW